MSRRAWLVGSLFLSGGFAAGWVAVPRQSAAPVPSGAEPRAVARNVVEKDRFGNRLTGEEGQEPIADVIEVVDLSQVYEPKSDELPAPLEMPPLSEMEADKAAAGALGCASGVVCPCPATGPHARRNDTSESRKPAADAYERPHYGEETSEPPAVSSGSLATWFRGACANLWSRLMPLAGSTVPEQPADDD